MPPVVNHNDPSMRRMVQVGLIDPVQFIRLRYLPHTAERLVAANKQMCLQWGVAP